MRPGIKTTEFWASLATISGTLFYGHPWAAAVSAAAYALARAITKTHESSK